MLKTLVASSEIISHKFLNLNHRFTPTLVSVKENEFSYVRTIDEPQNLVSMNETLATSKKEGLTSK